MSARRVWNAIALVVAAAGARADEAPKRAEVRVELLGIAEIPRTLAGQRAKVGGLSGLAYRDSDGRWFAVSDDKEGGCLYELRVEVDGAPGGAVRASVVRALVLPPTPEDAEGLAWDGASFLVSYERPSAILRLREGARGLEEASRFALSGLVAANIRVNRGLESVTIVTNISTGRREVWAATETAISTDGPEAGATEGALCRALVYDAETGAPLREHVLRTLTTPRSVAVIPAFNSLTDLAGLPDGRLLALERSFSVRTGYDATIRVIAPGGGEADLRGASAKDYAGAHGGEARALDVRDVGTMVALGAPGTVNWEGLGVGPALTDAKGGRLLLIVSDDNFGADGQGPTKLAAFRLSGVEAR